jgi:hypothetical protein
MVCIMSHFQVVFLAPHSVSVPEKTLEHWSSQYVTYLYRSLAALWWPTRGEDIDVRLLPTRPGKAVQLELKTTTVAGVGLHDVSVDLGQLWEYRQRPLGHQPFYAFPWPNWHGNLTVAADAGGRSVTQLGFRRSGAKWWFADWMVILTAAEVAAVLHEDLMEHGKPERGKKRRLVRFDLNHSTVSWGSGAPPPEPIGWREFWPMLEECGRDGWPQLIRLPARMADPDSYLASDFVAERLREAATGQWDDQDLVTLEPDESGNYRIAPAPGDNLGGSPAGQADQIDDHRQIVFLDARALFRAR